MFFMNKVVTLVQEEVYHYRAPFFRQLHQKLQSSGVELRLAYEKTGNCRSLDSEPWTVHTPSWRLGKICWQDLGNAVNGSHLVVFPQMIRYPRSLIEQGVNWFRNRKTAFWGHGKYFDPAWDGKTSERLKGWLSKHVDWWFAYNNRSAGVVRDGLGYPAERITVVMNATDTHSMRKKANHTSAEDLQTLRNDLNCQSQNVGIYTGTLYSSKRIPFLLEASRRVRRQIPDFELIVVGSGDDSRLVEAAASQLPWIHYVGRKNDEEKVPYWMLAKILLIPGAVGLVVNDSLAMGLPMITSAFPFHGPEIDYLRHGENGWIVDDWDNVDAYAAATIQLMEDEASRAKLAAAALADGEVYTIEAMADRFSVGVVKALESERYRGFGSLRRCDNSQNAFNYSESKK
jgi:glycosyltransferase involved in cell wall biosynthesis